MINWHIKFIFYDIVFKCLGFVNQVPIVIISFVKTLNWITDCTYSYIVKLLYQKDHCFISFSCRFIWMFVVVVWLAHNLWIKCVIYFRFFGGVGVVVMLKRLIYFLISLYIIIFLLSTHLFMQLYPSIE